MLDFCRDASGNLVSLIWRFLDPDCKCHLESLLWKVFIYQNSFSYSHTLVTCNLCYNVYEFVIYVPALDTSCIFVLLMKFSFEKKKKRFFYQKHVKITEVKQDSRLSCQSFLCHACTFHTCLRSFDKCYLQGYCANYSPSASQFHFHPSLFSFVPQQAKSLQTTLLDSLVSRF